MSSCLCCFKSLKPKVVAIIAVIANAIGFFFLIWGIFGLEHIAIGIKIPYWIGFVLVFLSLIGVTILLIMIIKRNQQNCETMKKRARIIYILSMIFIIVGIITTFICLFLTFCSYISLSFFDALFNVKTVTEKHWAGVIIPAIFILIGGIITVICLRTLNIIFQKKIDTSVDEYERNGNVNTLETNPNITVNNYTQDKINTETNIGTNDGTNKGIGVINAPKTNTNI